MPLPVRQPCGRFAPGALRKLPEQLWAFDLLADETQRHQLTSTGTLAGLPGYRQPWLSLRGSVLITLLMICVLF